MPNWKPLGTESGRALLKGGCGDGSHSPAGYFTVEGHPITILCLKPSVIDSQTSVYPSIPGNVGFAVSVTSSTWW